MEVPSLQQEFSKENQPHTRSVTNKDQKRVEYSSNRSPYHSFIGVCTFAIFTILATTIGVLTVCLTTPKRTNQTCRFNFKRSAEQFTRYDSHPHHIGMGDFNEDGHLDVVVANAGTNNIGIFLNNHNETFASQMICSTGLGSRPYSVAVGDLNNDTHLDVIVANFGINSIGTHLGYGNGSFANPVITSLGPSRPLSLVIADFNDDNVLDVAVANYGIFTIAVLLGANDGSFRMGSVYETGYDSIPYSVAAMDLNHDRRLDIITVNYGTSELVILLADKDHNFVTQKYFTGQGSHPSSVTIGHFNNDNAVDIAVAYSGTGSIGIFLGNRNGTFTNQMTYPLDARSRPQFISIGDFNNDAHVDIVVLDSEYENLVILQGNGKGSFSIITRHSTGYNSNPSAFVIGDFNNDQKLDVAITNSGTNNVLVFMSYFIYPNTTRTEYIVGSNTLSYSIDVADFNEDTYLDIVVCNDVDNIVGIFLNLGNGTFRNQQIYDMGNFSGPTFVVSGDINNDHHPDIVVMLNGIGSIGVLLGSENGAFVRGSTFSTESNSSTYSIAVDDLNNDGNLDIVTTYYDTGEVGLFFGLGNGTFASMTVLFNRTDFHPYFVQVSDVNNDKNGDVVFSNGGSVGGGIVVLLGYGNGSFHSPLFISADVSFLDTFTIGDVNSDRLLDIVYTSMSFYYIGVLLGQGNGTFGTVAKYFSVLRSAAWSVALGYYNNDAFIDIAVSLMYYLSIGRVNIYLGMGNGSFGTPTSLYTGDESIPAAVRFADFNNDHQQDIVVLVNDRETTIQIFFVHSEADFTRETSYTTGSSPHPVSSSAADLNNDGQSDLIVANSGNDDIQLLFHYSNGIFINTTIFSTGLDSHPQSVTIADFNHDHLLDIAVVNAWDDTMNVFLKLGDGSFATRSIYSTGTGSAPNSIVAGDLNKDGRMDIVIADQDIDSVGVFLAFDYASFNYHVIDIPGADRTPSYVSTGDFNNDHLLDIAVVNTNAGSLGIYLGYGDGTLFEQAILSTGYLSLPNSLAVDDLNNDHYLDLVVANLNSGTIGVFLGYGNGSFQPQIPYSTGNLSAPFSVAIADFNQDSQLDIVVVVGVGEADGQVWIFLGYGNGSFRGEIVYSMINRTNPVWVVVDDLNKDTNPDIVVANRYGDNLCLLFGYGNGSFGNVTTLSTGNDSEPVSVALGDFNGDKSIDIVVVNQNSNTIGLFFGYGNGAFTSQNRHLVSSKSYLQSIIASDVNNDTILDILVVDYSSMAIYYGFGDGNFTLPTIYPTASDIRSGMIATGDFNNDSRVDLAVSYLDENSIGVFIQVKIEPFTPSSLFSTGDQSHPKSVVLGDFNNDDRLDIAVTNSGTNTIGIRLGHGNGDFADQLTYSTGINSHPCSLSVDHFDDDDYLDIAVVNNVSGSIFLGRGDGSFIQFITYSTGVSSFPVAIAAKDLNNDSHVDLTVANQGSNEVLIFLGIGNGTFLEPKRYSVGYNARPQSVAIVDINNDGMLDIAVANYGTGYVEILLQTC